MEWSDTMHFISENSSSHVWCIWHYLSYTVCLSCFTLPTQTRQFLKRLWRCMQTLFVFLTAPWRKPPNAAHHIIHLLGLNASTFLKFFVFSFSPNTICTSGSVELGRSTFLVSGNLWSLFSLRKYARGAAVLHAFSCRLFFTFDLIL